MERSHQEWGTVTEHPQTQRDGGIVSHWKVYSVGKLGRLRLPGEEVCCDVSTVSVMQEQEQRQELELELEQDGSEPLAVFPQDMPGVAMCDAARAIPEGCCALLGLDSAQRDRACAAFLRRARECMARRDVNFARASVLSALECNPDCVPAHVFHVRVLETAGELQSALQVAEQLHADYIRSNRKQFAIDSQLRAEILGARSRLRSFVTNAARSQDFTTSNHAGIPLVQVDSHQKYRLCLLDGGIRRTLSLGVPFAIRMAILNEFNVFQRSDFKSIASCSHELACDCTLLVRVHLVDHDTGLDSVHPVELVTATGEPHVRLGASGRGSVTCMLAQRRGLTEASNSSSRFAGESCAWRIECEPDQCHAVTASGDDEASRKSSLTTCRSVISVSTLPFELTFTAHSATDNAIKWLADCGGYCRKVILPPATRVENGDATMAPAELLIAEAPAELGIGGKVWDSAFSMIRFVAQRREWFQGRRCVELGAGTGLVSLATARLASPQLMVVTDLAEVLPLLRANVTLNQWTAHCAAPQVRELCWGTPLDEEISADVILCSDVVYDPELYHPLVETLSELFIRGPDHACCYMAYRQRHPQSADFWTKLTAAGFTVDTLSSFEADGVRILRIVKAAVNGCPGS